MLSYPSIHHSQTTFRCLLLTMKRTMSSSSAGASSSKFKKSKRYKEIFEVSKMRMDITKFLQDNEISIQSIQNIVEAAIKIFDEEFEKSDSSETSTDEEDERYNDRQKILDMMNGMQKLCCESTNHTETINIEQKNDLKTIIFFFLRSKLDLNALAPLLSELEELIPGFRALKYRK